MILVYAEEAAHHGNEHTWQPLGLVASVAQAQGLCAAYSQQRVPGDLGEYWHLAWIDLGDEELSLARIRALLTDHGPEQRACGDDTTEAEAVAQQVQYHRVLRGGVWYDEPVVEDTAS